MIIGGMEYYSIEKPFVEYFDRLHRICKLSVKEIEEKLPQLEKYYNEMVVDEIIKSNKIDLDQIMRLPSLTNLFREWRNNGI